MPVLYKFNGSAPSRSVLMAIEILKLHDKIKIVDVNPILGETRTPEFLKKNHLHSIPVLETDEITICESHVILTYLVLKYAADSSLYSKELVKKCAVDERLYFESTCLTPKIITCMDSIRKGLPGPTQEQIDALKEVYGFVDKFLEKTTYLAAENLTLADISCVSSIATLSNLVPIPDEYKKLLNWYSRLEKEDWFQKINAPGVKLFAHFVEDMKAKHF